MPRTSPPTKSGTRKLSDVAKHLAVPTGITSTGWPAVRKTCNEKLGITFDDWQEGAGRVILAKRSDGNLAAMIDGVGMSLPRQVGKTYLIGSMVFALCVNMPGLLVIWSAHHARTHGETFLAMQGFADRAKVAAHVKQVFTGSGDEEIRFHNGSRILFGARERGFGRGIPGVDILVFDEAQILSDRALSNMLATMNTSRFGLQLYIGTPPKPDDMSESFTRMRSEAIAGTLTDGAWIEFGADPDAKSDDREQWRKANPSYPTRTPAQSLLRLKRKLTEADWLREGMGVWDELRKNYAFGAGNWELCALEHDPGPQVDAIALAVSMDRLAASIGAAGGLTVEGEPRLMVAAVDRREGTGWLVPEAWRIHQERRCPVVVTRSAADLIPALEAVGFVAGKSLIIARSGDAQDACAQIFDRVQQGTLAHAHHEELDKAVYGAHRRTINGERWVWDRKNSVTDVSMLEAVTLAAWQVAMKKPAYDLLDSIG